MNLSDYQPMNQVTVMMEYLRGIQKYQDIVGKQDIVDAVKECIDKVQDMQKRYDSYLTGGTEDETI